MIQIMMPLPVSLREKGVDLNVSEQAIKDYKYVSLREKGVDLNTYKDSGKKGMGRLPS